MKKELLKLKLLVIMKQ